MIPIATRILVSTLISTSVCILVYYAALVIIPHLLEEEHRLRALFPDPYYGVAIALLVVVLTLASACILAGVLMLQATYVNYQKLHGNAKTISGKKKADL
jgi:hypothetical protein